MYYFLLYCFSYLFFLNVLYYFFRTIFKNLTNVSLVVDKLIMNHETDGFFIYNFFLFVI